MRCGAGTRYRTRSCSAVIHADLLGSRYSTALRRHPTRSYGNKALAALRPRLQFTQSQRHLTEADQPLPPQIHVLYTALRPNLVTTACTTYRKSPADTFAEGVSIAPQNLMETSTSFFSAQKERVPRTYIIIIIIIWAFFRGKRCANGDMGIGRGHGGYVTVH